jgi:DNA mismatch endonuclease (patch repair protein)
MLRRALHARGARFRLHRRLAPGCTPDLVLPGRRIAVFVDGDYWHSCPAHGRTRPFTGPNAVLWHQKMARNRDRDRHSSATAQAAGWTVVRVWECAIRNDPDAAALAVLLGDSPQPVWPEDARQPPDAGPRTPAPQQPDIAAARSRTAVRGPRRI